MRSSNPALVSNPFSGFRRVSTAEDAMTMQGTATKTLLLLFVLMATAGYTWIQFFKNPASINIWIYLGLIGGFVTALITVFKKEWAPVTAPIYAACEGLFLGALSASLEVAYPGIVIQATGLTMTTMLAMLAAYQFGLIRATDSFKRGIVAATGGIAIFYLISMVLSFFGVQMSIIYGNGLLGIGFSIFVVIIAALNFVLDFDFIEQGSRGGAPKYMEWYGAFTLMVTLVWLYIEILRLLSKLNERK